MGTQILNFILRHLGLQAGYFYLLFTVPYHYLFDFKGRRGLSEYWQLVAPLEPWSKRQWGIMMQFFRVGQLGADRTFQSLSPTKPALTEAVGLEHIQHAIRDKQGLIVLTAHLGDWNFAATTFFSDEVQLVQSKNLSMNEMESLLKNGHCLAFAGDRPSLDHAELLPFLGKVAKFDTTALRLAALTGAPLSFAFFCKSGEHYTLTASAPKVYAYNEGEPQGSQCFTWTCEYAREVERMIRLHPDQWFNFYPFWSALPTQSSSVSGKNSL